MARRPSVFVRSLSMDEGRKLQRVTRTSKDPVRMRRAIVVMMSGQGQAVRDITSLLQVSAEYVRDVIHAFNERGVDALDPKWSGGRPRAIGEQVRERICLIARTSPADWGITAFATWSLAKLREHLIDRGTVAAISRETLRRILRAGGVSWQATTTWKASTDPDFIAKMHRILALYDQPPTDGRVVCVDEFGLPADLKRDVQVRVTIRSAASRQVITNRHKDEIERTLGSTAKDFQGFLQEIHLKRINYFEKF